MRFAGNFAFAAVIAVSGVGSGAARAGESAEPWIPDFLFGGSLTTATYSGLPDGVDASVSPRLGWFVGGAWSGTWANEIRWTTELDYGPQKYHETITLLGTPSENTWSLPQLRWSAAFGWPVWNQASLGAGGFVSRALGSVDVTSGDGGSFSETYAQAQLAEWDFGPLLWLRQAFTAPWGSAAFVEAKVNGGLLSQRTDDRGIGLHFYGISVALGLSWPR